jgi:2-(1,2-epoxy-1,2-dihydrophenyl)acetyl-CoA isomerase
VRRVGPSRAKEFFFRNRPLDAAHCLDWGIVNSVYPDDRLTQEAEKLATELAQSPTLALSLTKRLVDRAWKRDIEEQ